MEALSSVTLAIDGIPSPMVRGGEMVFKKEDCLTFNAGYSLGQLLDPEEVFEDILACFR